MASQEAIRQKAAKLLSEAGLSEVFWGSRIKFSFGSRAHTACGSKCVCVCVCELLFLELGLYAPDQ